MNTEDLVKLRDQAAGELTISRANLTQIDEQLETLRNQRREVVANINKATGALRFAEIALAPVPPPAAPKPSPALERSKQALDALTEVTAPPAAEPDPNLNGPF